MQETIYDPKTGLHYKFIGDYYIPLVKAPDPPQIGIWGQRRLDYLKNHRRVIYHSMMKETLNPHLEEVDRTATEMFDRLIKQFVTAEGITEDLKTTSQMEWITHMNNIHSRVIETVHNELFFI